MPEVPEEPSKTENEECRLMDLADEIIQNSPLRRYDPITNPAHYTFSQIEPITVIEAWGLGYHDGQVIKYISRWNRKGGVEDLKKAAWYLARLIENLEGQA